MAQEQVRRERQDDEPEVVEPEKLETDTDIDALLSEIDEVLEENAEEFVSQYVQKGGE